MGRPVDRRRGMPRCHRDGTRRTDQQHLAGARGRVHVPGRLPLLREVYRGESDGAQRHARHAGRAPGRRQGLRPDQQVGGHRPPLRGHRRPRTPGRSHAGRAVRLPAGHALADRRGGAGRLRPGLRDPVLLDPARRQVARPDGARGGQPARRPTSSRAIWPSDRPSRRSEKKRITKSCTPPPSTAPATSHSVPGR